MIKTKLAALLRRWAYALQPETSATLPPGYKVAKVVSLISHPIQDGKMPTEAEVSDYRKRLAAGIVSNISDLGYIRYRADIAAVPGGLIDYEASLYVGFIPKKTK